MTCAPLTDDPAVRTVKEVIAACSLALEEHDTLNTVIESACLESDQFRNEADWEEILGFCRRHDFDGRIEVLTRSLINSGRVSSSRPYIVLATLLAKSGRKTEARAVVDEYRLVTARFPASQWDLVSLLFSVDDFARCLDEARKAIRENGESFAFLLMEVRALWALNDVRNGRIKLKALSQLASGDPGNLVWYASVTTDLGERGLLKAAVLTLMKMIENGSAKLSEGAVHALQRAGYAAELYALVRTANPARYQTLAELEYVFELAKHHGAYAAAKNFGAAILATAPDHQLAPEIEKLSLGKGFMMI